MGFEKPSLQPPKNENDFVNSTSQETSNKKAENRKRNKKLVVNFTKE